MLAVIFWPSRFNGRVDNACDMIICEVKEKRRKEIKKKKLIDLVGVGQPLRG